MVYIKCKNCGTEFEGNFCPNCGAPARIYEPMNQAPLSSTRQVRPKKKRGCLTASTSLFFLVFVVFIIAMIKPDNSDSNSDPEHNDATITQAPSEEDVKKSLLEFDAKTWEDFKLLYTSHNNFMEIIDMYANSKITALNFYDYCGEAEDYFQNASLSLDYGTTDDEKTYLSAFEIAALADQQAAQKLMKYIDSGKTSDLSDAQEQIQRAKDAFVMIASNRGKLLIKAGLTDEEITEKVEEDMAALDKEEGE